MKKMKHLLTLTLLASSTLLFTGCVTTTETFDPDGSIISSPGSVNVSLISTAYPYYYDRPYYFFGGRYYYGGYYDNGLYHYGHRVFRRGHYYHHGYRYYKGRKYRAVRGRDGYYARKVPHRKHNTKGFRERIQNLEHGRRYESHEHKREHVLVSDTLSRKLVHRMRRVR